MNTKPPRDITGYAIPLTPEDCITALLNGVPVCIAQWALPKIIFKASMEIVPLDVRVEIEGEDAFITPMQPIIETTYGEPTTEGASPAAPATQKPNL